MPTPEVPDGYEAVPLEADPYGEKLMGSIWASLTHYFDTGEDDSEYLRELFDTAAKGVPRSTEIVTYLWGIIAGLVIQASADNDCDPREIIQKMATNAALYFVGIDPSTGQVAGG